MSSTLRPDSAEAVLDVVRWAAAEETPLEVIGHGSKRGVGRPPQAEFTLDLSALAGVTLYEPEELVLSAKAGTPLAEIEALLASRDQAFAFEPMDYGPLFGAARGRGTLGGALAANVSGPRRIKAGAARDHVLGVKAVSGRGEAFKSGGRVVKNVTGYDLSKLMAGSWGTLAVMTEMTLKVMPKAESERTLVLDGLDDVAANRAMTASLGSSYDVSAAAHLPASQNRGSVEAFEKICAPGRSATLFRLEGIGASVIDRAKSLSSALSSFGQIGMIEDAGSARAWAAIRDVEPFAANGPVGSWPVWRIVCPPASGCAFGLALAKDTGGEVFYDWGGGLIWAALPPAPDAHAKMLRERLKTVEGHATLVRASDEVRGKVDVFNPQQPGVAALGQRVKASFDPKNILNRGRMVRT